MAQIQDEKRMAVGKITYFDQLIGIKSDIINSELILTFALKQLSRGRYEIKGNECHVRVLLEKEVKTVVLTNNVSVSTLRDLLWTVSPDEASVEFMREQVYDFDKTLIQTLLDYQNSYYKLGTEYGEVIWYKLYSKEYIEDDMRKLYDARWIDYEKQLKNGTIIYDEYSINGIFAMPLEMLFQCFNDECKKRYGENLLVLRPVSECKYLHDGKEIIGERFEVIHKINLCSFYDIGELCKTIVTDEKRRHNSEIEEFEMKMSNLENDMIREMRKREYLECNNKILVKKKWMWLLIGMILGTIFQIMF